MIKKETNKNSGLKEGKAHIEFFIAKLKYEEKLGNDKIPGVNSFINDLHIMIDHDEYYDIVGSIFQALSGFDDIGIPVAYSLMVPIVINNVDHHTTNIGTNEVKGIMIVNYLDFDKLTMYTRTFGINVYYKYMAALTQMLATTKDCNYTKEKETA